jgi:hypothetical protein
MTAYYTEIYPFAAQWLRTLITQGQLPLQQLAVVRLNFRSRGRTYRASRLD